MFDLFSKKFCLQKSFKYLFIYIFKYSSSPRGHVNPAGPGNPVSLGSISWTVSSTNWDGYGKEMMIKFHYQTLAITFSEF